MWSAAVQQVAAEYATLPPSLRERVGELTAAIRAAKREFQGMAAASGAEKICAACRGLCCGHGKHHFTVVDLLSLLAASRETPVPAFATPDCPYHDGTGCSMSPEFRPFNCIIFLCEEIENETPVAARVRLETLEKELRRLYLNLEQLLGNRFANGLLIAYERSLQSGSFPLLKYEGR
jgi:hypothetical protein